MKGIDVSNNLGNIDFNAVKNSGVEVVYIKATEGKSYKDPYLIQNYQRAKQAGLKVGFYHYSWNHGAEGARWFYNTIKDLSYDCKLALDIEQTNNLGKSTITQKCIEFLEELERLTGKQTIIYTYTSFARENLDSKLSKYPVWIAEYGVSNPHSNPIWGTNWAGFQYSESGNIPGINGGCDLNNFKEEVLLDTKQGYVITNYLPNGWQEIRLLVE